MIPLHAVEEDPGYNRNFVYYWNHAGLELNRLTHSLAGPQTGPTISSAVLGILHLAIHDAYFAICPSSAFSTYLTVNAVAPVHQLPPRRGANDAEQAVAGAAVTVLEAFYARRNIGSNFSLNTGEQLNQLLLGFVNGYAGIDALSASYRFGISVGMAMLDLLSVKPNEPGASQGAFRPRQGRYFFRDEPGNPVRRVPVDPNNPAGPKRTERIYHAPFYGMTAKRFAVQMEINGKETEHVIADPPVGFGTHDLNEYNDAVREVIAMGGAAGMNSTRRNPDQTVGAYFWAYDSSNLIGTPPRLYNQILRRIAWQNTHPDADDDARTAEFVRLFALVNAALADAGIFSWREKYCFEFWRPLTGVREHDPSSGPAAKLGGGTESPIAPLADPFWLTLGAPETNTDRVSFKPPFPSYPSGHATFGAAAFQMARLYYANRPDKNGKQVTSPRWQPDAPDCIEFSFVSDELNGISRDLHQDYDPTQPISEQPGTVRTRVVRRFPSLWAAIFDNAISRIWLGVHWRFDAFAARDVLAPAAKHGNSPPYKIAADGTTIYKDPGCIRYETPGTRADRPGQEFPIGGVPLGLGIANDIFGGQLKPTPLGKQPVGRQKCGIDDLPTTPAQAAELKTDVVTPKAEETLPRSAN